MMQCDKRTPGCHDSDDGWCHHFVLVPEDNTCDCGMTMRDVEQLSMSLAEENYHVGVGMEECDELSQRLSKWRRFGPDEVQPDAHQNPEQLNNRERVKREYFDVIAQMETLGIYVDLKHGSEDRKLIDAKKDKVARYMELSKSLGRL